MLIEESLKMVENGVGKVLYKIELLLIKVIPFIIMFCYALNNILYYFDIEVIFLSTFSGLSILTWIFLYISSFIYESEHIKQSILVAYNIDDIGEPPAYIVGYIATQLLLKLL